MLSLEPSRPGAEPVVAASKRLQTSPTTADHVNFVNFNQDATCISVGYNTGYKIFHCDPFVPFFHSSGGSVGIVEMLFNTSLVAVVGTGDHPLLLPRRLKVINTKRQVTIVEVTFPTTILAVKMNRERMVVILEEQVYIYDIKTIRLLHTIETPPNPLGICALSPCTERNYLVYPSPPRAAPLPSHPDGGALLSLPSCLGDVVVFNAETMQPVTVVEAHKTALAAMCLNASGTLLATASDKGTIVRVFDVETGVKMYQFRRGTYATHIYSLSFSDDDRFITATSATETVHIFRLGEEEALANRRRAPRRATALTEVAEGDEELDGAEGDEDDEMGHVDDDSDVEDADSFEDVLPLPKRRTSSQGSVGSTGLEDRVEPLVDSARRSVGRMIRRSSQTLGRKAAEKMGTFLPSKFSSLLEPTRHFASLKVPAQKDGRAIASIGKEMGDEDLRALAQLGGVADNPELAVSRSAESDPPADGPRTSLLHVLVITSDGFVYNYGLDPDRGGDCLLLNQHSLVDPQKP